MAIIGQGVQAGLGRVDYTPYLQGAMAGAQGIAQGISSVGKSAADAVQEYQKNKQANDLLEADNAAMLRQLSTVPEYKQFAPDPDTIQKYQDKMIKGGLSLTENKKLNAELNVAFKVADNVFKIRQQQTYADQAAAATNRMKFELDTAKKDQAKLDQFNTQLAQIPQGELTPDKIFEIGVQLGAPSNVVNSAVGGRLDIGKYELSKKVNEANLAKDVLERQKLDLELERIKQANPGATIVEVDGNRAWKFVDQSGKVSYDPIKEPKVTPTTMQQLGSIVQMYKAGVANGDQVMVNAAITDFAEATGKKGSVWTLDAIGDELASFAAKVPSSYAPPAGGAGIRAAKPVSAEQKAPGTAPAPAAPSKQEVPVKTAGGAAVAQPGLPPQPVTPYTPIVDVRQQEDAAALQAAFAARQSGATQGVGQAVNDYTATLAQAAPQPPVVDVNLYAAPSEVAGPHTAGRLEPSMRFGGYNYPATSALGVAERLSGVLGPVEQQMQIPGRAVNELGRYGAAALTGLATGDYTVPQQGLVDMASETMAKYLSRPNLAGETVRSLAQGAGMVPDTTQAGAPANLPSATLDVMAQPLESVAGARERMRREDELAKKKPAKAAAPRPMQSAEIPQISLSKDAKRIADLLLQEYENKKGGKAPTFTITAAREGGKETSIKLSNPAILAVLSNPTNFGGLIRGNVETFSQQNARMNQILAEMEAARAARTRTVRGR